MLMFDVQYLNAVWAAGFIGYARYDEQKLVLQKAVQGTTCTADFLDRVAMYGIATNTQLYKFLVDYLAAPSKYVQTGVLARLSSMNFIASYAAVDAVSPMLTNRQYELYRTTFGNFKAEHMQQLLLPGRKRWRKGRFAGLPTDNHSTLQRFHAYLRKQAESSGSAGRKFADFPVELVLQQLAFVFGEA